ncbi:AraC-like DNA-binding protein [Christiangramia gaetbulicola]|uniref:AraC-like DNA-binding protein n=1 Tax=Christiangramia gaetbulicola TaxID=703340 RepID=A0A2T6ACX0_9FLAO|nr:triple tyrosine motif-containing protein [Christiangramia gaetbulicola]PTX41660.1 AraC-like DNA-binding protein [Christiangramia gaetbulicola]
MGYFKFRTLLSFMIILGITGKLIGQNANSVQRVKAIEAFSKAEEVQIQQDLGDNLWITTTVKVIKYNSVEVQDFNKFRGVPREIGNEYIATYTDSENKTWLSGASGIAIFQPEKDQFEFVSDITGRVYAMKEDHGKQLWIAAENGVFKLNIDSAKKDFGLSRFLSENTLATDIALFDNKIIFAGPNGLLTIDRRSGKFNKIDMGYLRDLQISSLQPLDDILLIGTLNKGLYKIDAGLKNMQKVYTLPYAVSQKEISDITRFDDEVIISTKGAGIVRLDKDLNLLENESIYPENIYQIFLNQQNLLWMVTKEGLFLSNFSGSAVEKLKNDPARYSSLANDFVTATEKDTNGKVWFGTAKGLSIWNTETDRWQHIQNLNYKKHLEEPDEITDLAAVGEHMWVATASDGIYKINIHTLLRAHYSEEALYKIKVNSARALFIDAGKNIWVGGEDGYVSRISPNNQVKNYPVNNVQAIAELGPRKIILATGSGVHSLDPNTGRLKDLEKLSASAGMMYYGINDVKITREGLGLFATNGAGLLCYDFETEEVKILNEESGLPSNNLNGIEIDLDSGYWLSSDKGMVYYEPEEDAIKVYSELNGLSTTELTTGFARLEDGSLVLGSSKGVNIFKPKTMLAQQDLKPRLEINSLFLPKEKDQGKSNIDLAATEKVELDENTGFRISFAGYSHLAPEAIQYSWKLEGLDNEWSKPSALTYANYSNLTPGLYTFKVKAKVDGSAWTKPETLNIQVAAVGGTVSSVYLFMGISVLAMIGIFVVVFIKRSKNAELAARAELRDQLQKEFKRPIESAVKSLSKISAEAEQGNTEDLQRYAARFDDLFNQILNFNYQGSVYEISKIHLKTHFPKLLKDIEPVYNLKDLEVIVNDQWGEADFYYNMEMLDKLMLSLISGSAGYSLKNGKIIINLIETSIGDLKMQITDNGRGIPESDIRILEKKKTVGSSPSFRDKSGLRYILKAKDLIAKAGGSFSYETEKNEGSTFTVVLKNRKEDYRKVPERAAAIFKAEKAKPKEKFEIPTGLTHLGESKILIIESEIQTRKFLVKGIGEYCQIYQATSAEEGLEKASMIFPDIIISATMLPEMNAFQLSKMIKRNIGLNHINIFLIADEDQQINDMQLDEMTEVIRKPVDLNTLLSKISQVLIWQRDLRNSYVQSYKEHKQPEFRTESDKKFIQSLNDVIIQNIKNENFTVHDLSAAQGITSNTLFMKLKSLVDLSPQDFMEFTRLNYARDLMEHTDMNVMEIAYKSGFSSPKIFDSSFKKFYGIGISETVEKRT